MQTHKPADSSSPNAEAGNESSQGGETISIGDDSQASFEGTMSILFSSSNNK